MIRLQKASEVRLAGQSGLASPLVGEGATPYAAEIRTFAERRAKRDRLARGVIKVATIEQLIEREGARVVSAAGEGTDSDDPTAMLMRRMIDAFAEYERLLIGLRTKGRVEGEAESR